MTKPPFSQRLARLRALRSRAAGHLHTIAPTLRHRLRPLLPPPSRPWRAHAHDPDLGPIPLNGTLHEVAGAETIVVLVHGLGGQLSSLYCIRGARAVTDAGLSCLRLELRGSDRQGPDVYHAGQVDDVAAALRSPELASYRHVALIGYSMGGNVTLRAALARVDPRLRAAVAVCAPLDLAASQRFFDHRSHPLYRRHILGGLKAIYTGVARLRDVPAPLGDVLRVRTVRAWDELVVVPRYGFLDADDYYARASAASSLDALDVPALVVASHHDPMVTPEGLRSVARRASDALELAWTTRGGHVHFPPDADLGLGLDGLGVDAQIVAWLLRQLPT